MCLGALIPKRTRFRPTSKMVISMSSATMIFWSFLRLMINIRTYPFKKCSHSCREIPEPKKYSQFCQKIQTVQFWESQLIDHSLFNFSKISGTIGALFMMMKYLLPTTSLILLLFTPIQAQEIQAERLLTVAGTNYVNQL